MKDAKNKERERDDTRRTPELYEADERPQGPAGSDDSWRSVLGLRGLVWGTSTLLFVGW
jgi:hypothetical protein